MVKMFRGRYTEGEGLKKERFKYCEEDEDSESLHIVYVAISYVAP